MVNYVREWIVACMEGPRPALRSRAIRDALAFGFHQVAGFELPSNFERGRSVMPKLTRYHLAKYPASPVTDVIGRDFLSKQTMILDPPHKGSDDLVYTNCNVRTGTGMIVNLTEGDGGRDMR